MPDYLSFHLSDSFIETFIDRPVAWGFDIGGGNSLGELTFLSKYSRKKEDGTKERWYECCRRVIEGMYSILKDHCLHNKIPWTEAKAQRSAQEAFERMFTFKWLPPGRGLAMMGTYLVNGRRDSAALNNCSFISFDKISSRSVQEAVMPFMRLMEMSMLGIGVGFNTKGAGKLTIHKPLAETKTLVVPDTREGWAESLGLLLESYFFANRPAVVFDYTQIRPEGAPIKTFGGIAPGPEPLIKLHRSIRKLFEGREGETLTTSDIVDINNLSGKCVVSGGIRRTAEMALGESNDEAFLDLKNWEVNPERMGADGWGYTSNNSVYANVGDDISHLIDRVVENGEPGILYLDVVRKHGRLVDPPNNKDYRATGTNPCSFAGETIVMTTNGPKRIDALDGEPFWALVNGEAFLSPTGSWVTGEDDIYLLTTREGYEVRITPTHRVMRADGSWCEARDLGPGDKIQIHNHRVPLKWASHGTWEEGYLTGLFLGDGYYSGGAKSNTPICQVWQDDEGFEGIKETAHQAALTIPHRGDWKGWRSYSDRPILSMSPGVWIRDYLAPGDKHIADQIETSSYDFHTGFLRGLFDADGHIEGWEDTQQYKGMSIRLGQSHLGDLKAVQRMLLRLGVKSRIYRAKASGKSHLPNGKGGYDWYDTKASWRLVVSGDDVPVFADKIGFSHTLKNQKLMKGLASHGFYSKPFIATVDSYEFLRRDRVWDLTVSTKHAFDANGLYVSNSEQSLESMELCTLVETFPINHESAQDFLRTLKFAYLYGKAVTLLPTPWPDSNGIMQRNRRIGCSVSGSAQFVERYGWTELRTWLSAGYDEVQRRDRTYSEWLGVRESIKTTSVKPSGCRPWEALTTTDQGILTLEEVFAASGHREGEEWHSLSGYSALQGGVSSPIAKTYDNGKAEVMAIKMGYGMEVRSTPNHRWWVTERCRRNTTPRHQMVGEWVRTDELQPGDVLEIVPGIYTSTTEASLLAMDSRSISMRGDAIEIMQPSQMSPELAWFLGYLWGDGAMSPNRYRLRFIDANEENLLKAQDILRNLFGIEAVIHLAPGNRKAKTLEVGSKVLWHWLIKNGVWKYYADHIDVIPEVVRRSSAESILAFIAGLIDADGCIVNRPEEKTLTLASADAEFARHVQDVALAVGIVFGRSHNTGGENKQIKKSMWLMTMAADTLGPQLKIMASHSNKMSASQPDVPWSSHRRGKGHRILGKVTETLPLGFMPTFDVEVDDTHWYYAGAVKSHNTVSLLAGVTPGVHWPVADVYIRRMRLAKFDPLLSVLEAAGYKTEPDVMDPDTSVCVELPALGPEVRTEREVSVWEKAQLAIIHQRYWADNQVSVTLTFDAKAERDQIKPLLQATEGQLKSVSLLPLSEEGAYQQMPYERISRDQYERLVEGVQRLDWDHLYGGAIKTDAEGDRFCTNDRCEIPSAPFAK